MRLEEEPAKEHYPAAATAAAKEERRINIQNGNCRINFREFTELLLKFYRRHPTTPPTPHVGVVLGACVRRASVLVLVPGGMGFCADRTNIINNNNNNNIIAYASMLLLSILSSDAQTRARAQHTYQRARAWSHHDARAVASWSLERVPCASENRSRTGSLQACAYAMTTTTMNAVRAYFVGRVHL